MKTLEYTIVEEYNPDKLSGMVTALIEDGWEPIGGVAICVEQNETIRDGESDVNSIYTYAQAMIRREVNQ